MKIQTFSVVVGTNACNAKCPFCVSKMTMTTCSTKEINWRNLEKGCNFAERSGVSTALITGKGEPTLFIGQVLETCKFLKTFFPFIELQTNGYSFQNPFTATSYLDELYSSGLTTVIISFTHYDDDKNNTIYQFPNVLQLKNLIKKIHDVGLSVRLSCIMLKGYIDSITEIENLLNFCKKNEVEQLTIRSVETPFRIKDEKIFLWTKEHKIDEDKMEKIKNFFQLRCKLLMKLSHGAVVYDYDGQNLCISNCLTHEPNSDDIRQLIFFPDGHLYYDWQYTGAILL